MSEYRLYFEMVVTPRPDGNGDAQCFLIHPGETGASTKSVVQEIDIALDPNEYHMARVFVKSDIKHLALPITRIERIVADYIYSHQIKLNDPSNYTEVMEE